jgi:hypothetical protein
VVLLAVLGLLSGSVLAATPSSHYRVAVLLPRQG